jgi:hypothetical protein
MLNERPVQRCIGLLAYYDVMCQGNRFLTHMLLNKEIAQNADALSSNPLKALGYKLYKTFGIIKGDEAPQMPENSHFSVIA